MVQLKQVQIRLKSIKNIQKITKTMKMVSASKFTRAERELAAARPFGYGPRKFYESSQLVLGKVDEPELKGAKAGHGHAAPPPPPPPEVKPVEAPKEGDVKKKRIYIAVTSDRGLCGGVHSGIARRLKREFAARKADDPEINKILCIGDKSRGMLVRSHPKHIIVSVKDIGRNVPVFADAAAMAASIANAKYTFDMGEMYYNKYFSPVKYELSVIPFFSKAIIETAPNLTAFDDIDDDLESYSEWTVAALIYYGLKENSASELSARMSAMDNATKNASEMIRKLTLLFNRTRQAVITRELIEIISGAAALE